LAREVLASAEQRYGLGIILLKERQHFLLRVERLETRFSFGCFVWKVDCT
jgi:hypothetical protein